MNDQLPSDWETKVWGRTRLMSKGQRTTLHELELVEGTYCSFHYHKHRKNGFHLQRGAVRVVWCVGCELRHEDLRVNRTLVIPAMVPHQFQVLESGLMVETYHTTKDSIDLDDIRRLTEGNRLPEGRKFEERPEIYNKAGQILDQRWITP